MYCYMLTAKRTGKQEFLLTELKLSIIGLPYIVAVTLLSFTCYLLIWDSNDLLWGIHQFFTFLCIPLVITGLFLEEFFFRLTLALFCKFPMSRFWYGFNLNQLMKCGGREIPSGIKCYRWAIALPHIISGIVPLTVGIIINYPFVYIFGYLFTLAAVGDVVLLWESRHIDSQTSVTEHPSGNGIMLLNNDEQRSQTTSLID